MVAWPYASGDRHMGHVAGAYVPPDIFARYHHMRGNDVIFVSGSDRAEQEDLLLLSEFADHAWRLWLDQPVCAGNGWFPGPPKIGARVGGHRPATLALLAC